MRAKHSKHECYRVRAKHSIVRAKHGVVRAKHSVVRAKRSSEGKA